MQTCPRCGFHNMDREARCVRCRAFLGRINDDDPLAPVDREAPRVELNRRGWTPIFVQRATTALLLALHRLGRALQDRPAPPELERRKAWLAGLLSMVPGLGHLYNRQPRKAVLFVLLVAAAWAIALANLYRPWSNGLLLAGLAAIVWSCNDAFISAQRINGATVLRQHALGFFVAWFFYIAIGCLLIQYVAGKTLFNLVAVISDEAAPYLRRGERYVASRIVFRLRDPRLGDVVVYRPPLARIERGEDLYLVKRWNGVERVVGLPGDTFSQRDGVFYRNGVPAPVAEQPVVQRQIGHDFKIVAPPDRFIIVYSYSTAQAPGIQQAIYDHWEELCLVPREDILSKPWFVYHPPAARRMLR